MAVINPLASGTISGAKISELDAATEANATDLLETSQVQGPGYVTKKVTLDQVSTVVAASEQIATVIDDAIAEIPPPPPNDWDSITGKPTTFPPTVPIAWDDISGEPSTFPPTIPTGGDIAAWPYLPLAGGTLTGGLTGTAATFHTSVAAGGAGNGYAMLNGSAAAGYLAFHKPDDGRVGYIGLGTDRIAYTAEIAGSLHDFTGDIYLRGILTTIVSDNSEKQLIKIENASTGAAAASSFVQVVGGTKFVNRNLNYAGNYLQENPGGGIVSRYSDFDTHFFRNNAGAAVATLVAGAGNSTLGTSPAYPNNTTAIATTAFVTAALAAGALISVGTTPPGSPSANQLWWNTDASVGGGTLYIYYDSFWVPASPPAGAGTVVQTVSFQTGAMATTTTLVPFDNTIPQIGEGAEFMTLAITPKSATSRLIIGVVFVCANSAASNTAIVSLFRDSTANALATAVQTCSTTSLPTMSFSHVAIAGSTSPTTFRVRAGQQVAGTLTFNGSGGAAFFGGALASSIVIQEVL